MAERTALDIVSLENAKHQLGIPPSVDTEDARITGHVKSAASYVSGETGIPLLPERINWEIRAFPSGKNPIDIPFTYIDSILKIAYWLPDGDFTQEPTHFVTGANLGRLREYSKDTHSGYYVYPPVGGWPQHLSGSGAVIVEIVRCVPSVPDGIAEAVILAMRDFYEGQREPAGAIRTILEPWMDAAQPQIAERMRRYALDGSSAIRITERSTGTGGDITPVAERT